MAIPDFLNVNIADSLESTSNDRKNVWNFTLDSKKKSQFLASTHRPAYVVLPIMLTFGIVEVQASTQTQEQDN